MLRGVRFSKEFSIALAFQADASDRALLNAGRKSAASRATVLARELPDPPPASADAPWPNLERLDCKSKSAAPPFFGVFLDPTPRPLVDLGSLSARISRSYSSTCPWRTSIASVSMRFSSCRLLISSEVLPLPFFVGDFAEASTPEAESICSSSDNLAFCIEISFDRDTKLFSSLVTLFFATSSLDSLSIASASFFSTVLARRM
mmetsp:Transcript_17080/g.37795  ORF Transcript_17080/g.37795 Transcript_17080/m.37795 type:complete len:204 (-) Transcript_17080:3945-4556(-)